MRIIGLFILLLMPFISKGQSKFESLRKKLVENKTYQYVSDFENDYATFSTSKGKMGLIDSTGNEIIKPKYEYIRNRKDLKNLFEVGNTVNKKFKYGYVDIKGKIRIPIEYDDVYYLDKDFIRVSKNKKTGVVDTLNRIIIPLKFDFIMNHGSIIYTGSNKIVDIFDFSGKQLSNFKAKDIDYFTDDRSIVILQDNNTFIIDNHGQIILNAIKNRQFETVVDSDSYIIRNTITNKKGVINSKGEYQIECKYDDIVSNKLVFIVKDKNKYGLVSKKDAILKPLIYDAIYPVHYQKDTLFQNQFSAKKGNLEGIINPFLENEIIPIQYKNVQTFSDYYIVTTLENKNGVFSENGARIVNEDYEFYNVSQNKIFAIKNNKKYLLTLAGNSFSEVEIPVDEFAKKRLFWTGYSTSNFQIFKNENKYGVISNKNEIVVACEYDSIEYIYSTAEFVVKKNKKYGVVNAKNQITLEIKYDSFQIVKEYIRFETKNPKTKKAYFVKNSSDY